MTEFNNNSFKSKLKRVSVGVLIVVVVSASTAIIVLFTSPSLVHTLPLTH